MANEMVKEELLEEEIEKDQFLIFTVNDQEFGIQAMRVQEISRVMQATPVPSAPSYVEGIVNLRGRLATVINFRKKFNFEDKPFDEDTRIVIIEQEGFPVGLVVDSVVEVIKVPENIVQKLPETSTTLVSKDYLVGVGAMDNRLIIILDIDKVINKKELVELKTEDVGQVRRTRREAKNKKEAA